MLLPPNLSGLFKPRDHLPFLRPGKLPQEKKFPKITGVSNFISLFEDSIDTPPPKKIKTLQELKEEKRKEKNTAAEKKLKEKIAQYNPKKLEGITGDPFKTLFVGRISYHVTESKLFREFEQFGRIKRVKLIYNSINKKPRGYAFVEFEKEEDMLVAYREGDAMKIDGKRVLVDVERGRTVEGFLPRRLGGGIGATRKGKPEDCVKHSGREPIKGKSPGYHSSESKNSSRHGERKSYGYRDRDDPGYRGYRHRPRHDRERSRERSRERDRKRERR